MRLDRVASMKGAALPLPALRGRAGVAVSPRFALFEWREFPPPAALSGRHSRSSLRLSCLRTAAEGGLCSRASGRGEVSSRPERFNRARFVKAKEILAAGSRCLLQFWARIVVCNRLEEPTIAEGRG